jgi:hypothetical protein
MTPQSLPTHWMNIKTSYDLSLTACASTNCICNWKNTSLSRPKYSIWVLLYHITRLRWILSRLPELSTGWCHWLRKEFSHLSALSISTTTLSLASPTMYTDMIHTVSINEIPSHWYNIIVKSIKNLQFQWNFLWIFKFLALTTRILTRRNSTLMQNYQHINKNKHQSKWAIPISYIFNSLFHHNLAHCLAQTFHCWVLSQICSISVLLY